MEYGVQYNLMYPPGSQQEADEDAILLQRIAYGERQALAELYARYQRYLFAYLLQFTPDRGLAEELLQDTFVAAWKSAHTFQQKSTVKTWLLGIARRQAHNVLRQRSLSFAPQEELMALPATDKEPEDALLIGINHEILVIAFQHLSFQHREILVLTFIQELSQQEVAQLLHIPLGTVKSRLSNARHQLRTQLAHLNAEEEQK